MPFRRRIPVYSIYKTGGQHPPLALGMIVALAKSYKGGLLNEYFEFIPGFLSSVKTMHETVGKYGAGVMLCSDYLWTSAENLKISKFAKGFFPDSIIVHGGPSVPKYDWACQEFCDEHSYVDVAVRGAGEFTIAEMLEQISLHLEDHTRGERDFLANVAGITYRGRDGTLVRTADRPPARDLDNIPSPYLTGEFGGDDARGWRAAIVETNRGCPYGCSFCDWGSATLSKIRSFSLERVTAEIEWIARHEVKIVFVADANFGIFERDIAIAQVFADCRAKYGFPNQIIFSYAKNATDRLAQIVRILHEGGIAVDGIIAIQTRDPQTLANTDRSNISTERYEELIEIFRRHKLPISSDLMIGLPGSTPDSFKADLQYFFDRAIPVKCYPTVLLPNSPMAHRDYREKYRIETGSTNRVVATYSYTRADLCEMTRLSFVYPAAVEASVLKYVLIHLQVDYGIKALDILAELSRQTKLDPTPVPLFTALIDGFPATLSSMCSQDWDRLYAEFGDFLLAGFGVDPMVLDTVLQLQRKLMPANDRVVPETIALNHDVAAYFARIRQARNLTTLQDAPPMRLADYGPRVLEISDPRDLCGAHSDHLLHSYDTHRIEWELHSSLANQTVLEKS